MYSFFNDKNTYELTTSRSFSFCSDVNKLFTHIVRHENWKAESVLIASAYTEFTGWISTTNYYNLAVVPETWRGSNTGNVLCSVLKDAGWRDVYNARSFVSEVPDTSMTTVLNVLFVVDYAVPSTKQYKVLVW
jgi:hypothetical protein